MNRKKFPLLLRPHISLEDLRAIGEPIALSFSSIRSRDRWLVKFYGILRKKRIHRSKQFWRLAVKFRQPAVIKFSRLNPEEAALRVENWALHTALRTYENKEVSKE